MPDEVYRRAATIMEAEIGGQLVALDPNADACFGFTAVARTVWRSLQQPKSFDQLRAELLAEYDVGREQCSAELQQLLDDLVDQGFVERRSGPFPTQPAPVKTAPRRAANPALSREFRALVECCGWTFAPRGTELVEALNRVGNWPLFVRLTRFHRVQGLVSASLSEAPADVPREVADALAADAADIAAANLVAAAESRSLLRDFDRAGVAVLFVKGLTLGQLAYGNASLKAAVDIDLLVPEGGIVSAAGLLRERGYRLVIPDGPPNSQRLRAWHGVRKESVWSRADVHIDLHSRLSDNRRLIPSIGLSSPTQHAEISNGIRLPTLAGDELFAYLCVHGASSAWFRLKWITDFAALIRTLDEPEIERLYRRSQELGAGRAAAQALLLADDLYGSLQGGDLREELSGERASRWLAATALRQLAGRAEPREPTEAFLGTGWIHLSQLALLPGLRFALSETVRQVRAAAA